MSELLAVFRALADPTRLRIFNLLSRGPLCVCHFQQILGISQVLISQHLASLRKTGMVERVQHAQWRVYRLRNPDHPHTRKLLRAIAEATGTEPDLASDIEQMEASLRDERFAFCSRVEVPWKARQPSAGKAINK
jgi:DNA-binding transcriptional ArsR family regulator